MSTRADEDGTRSGSATAGVTWRNWLRIKLGMDVALFLTHTPSGFEVGEIVDKDRTHKGAPTGQFRLTRIERVADTALLDGGRAPCYEVYGKRIGDSEAT